MNAKKEPAEPPPRPFAIGDRVTYTLVRNTAGGGFGFSRRDAVIAELHPSGATVKARNGRRAFKLFSALRHANEKSEIQQLLETMAGQPIGEKGGC